MNAKTAPKAVRKPLDEATEGLRKVWLAGLGAYSQAFKYAGDTFGQLVAEGQDAQKRVRKAEREAVNGLRGKVDALASKASKTLTTAGEGLQKYSAKVVNGLGLPTVDDVNDLSARVARLDKKVRSMGTSATSKVASAA